MLTLFRRRPRCYNRRIMRQAALGLCILAALLLASAGAAQGRQTDPIEQTDPAVGFDGTNYLVLWDRFDPNLKTAGTYATRVAQDGTVLDPDGIQIADGFRLSPKLAFDGTNYLVVWAEYRTGDADIFRHRVRPAG